MSISIRTSQGEGVQFAKEELLRYASLIFTDLDVTSLDLYLGLPEANETIVDANIDEIFIDVTAGKGKIVGSNGASVLIATYRFLRECGCRFLRPGKGGEYLPRVALAEQSVHVKEHADSEVRGIIIEGACSFENVYNMIDYTPKVGMNRYRFQFDNSAAFFVRWYSHAKNPKKESEEVSIEKIDAEVKRLKGEVKKRGLLLHTMGHGWCSLPFGIKINGWDKVDLSLPPEDQELLALVDGKREWYGGRPFETNLCFSNPRAQDKVIDYMVEYCRANPEADFIHIGLADRQNVTCECENCRTHRLSDLIVRLLNRADERLTKEGLPHRIMTGAYLDTLWPPVEETLHNPDRFRFGFCPISHVYHEPVPTEGIPDTEPAPYVTNQLPRFESLMDNMRFLRAWQKRLPELKGFMGEYHLMWDHYLDIGYQQIARVLHEDIRNQDKLGLCGMIMFQPQRCAVPTNMPVYAYAHTLWNHDTDFDALSRDYFEHAFGEGWEDVYTFLQTLSDTYDMKIKPGGRDYRALDCVPVLEKCIALTEDFVAKHPQKDSYECEAHAISWHDLALHNQYVIRYLGAYLLGLSGKEAEGKAEIDALIDWMWSMEDEVQERWDIFLHIGHLPVWYSRLMKIMHEEANEEMVLEEAKVDEGGVQD